MSRKSFCNNRLWYPWEIAEKPFLTQCIEERHFHLLPVLQGAFGNLKQIGGAKSWARPEFVVPKARKYLHNIVHIKSD